jgi:tRNA U38,U39,U40 pseudouridine synthase TruA
MQQQKLVNSCNRNVIFLLLATAVLLELNGSIICNEEKYGVRFFASSLTWSRTVLHHRVDQHGCFRNQRKIWIKYNIQNSCLKERTSCDVSLDDTKITGTIWKENNMSLNDEKWNKFWHAQPFRVAEHSVQNFIDTSTNLARYSTLFRPFEDNPRNDFEDRENKFDQEISTFYNNGDNIDHLNNDQAARNLNRQLVQMQQNSRRKLNFRLNIAYVGKYYCGWQRQSNTTLLPSVQQIIEDAIENSGCGKVDVRVSGRTDAGVHAIGQVARARISHEILSSLLHSSIDDNVVRESVSNSSTDIKIEKSISESNSISSSNRIIDNNYESDEDDNSNNNNNNLLRYLHSILECAASNDSYHWRCLSLTEEPNEFHPTFDSLSRSYVYLIDASALLNLILEKSDVADPDLTMNFTKTHDHVHLLLCITKRLNHLLHMLEGQTLDYLSFSYGKVKTETTLCCLKKANAQILTYQGKLGQEVFNNESMTCPIADAHQSVVLALEFTGNRFLRRMIRILVASALHHAIDPVLTDRNQNTDHDEYYDNILKKSKMRLVNDDALVDICRGRDRRLTCKAAPPGGLVFVHAAMKGGSEVNAV